jgi:hypothetical protein
MKWGLFLPRFEGHIYRKDRIEGLDRKGVVIGRKGGEEALNLAVGSFSFGQVGIANSLQKKEEEDEKGVFFPNTGGFNFDFSIFHDLPGCRAD